MTGSVIALESRGAEVGTYDPAKWGDFQMFPQVKFAGANTPTLALFSASLQKYKFVAGDIAHLVDGQINHDWDMSPIRPHVRFSSDNGGTGNIVWEMIYSYRTVFGAWSAEVTKTGTWTGTLTAREGDIAEFWTGDGEVISGAGTSMLIGARLRLVSKTFAGNVFVDGWDCHYRKNRAGTTGEFV